MKWNKMVLPDFSIGEKYKPFEIVKVDKNTVVIEGQVIPHGTKKGYKCRLMFDFEKMVEYDFKEDMNDNTQLIMRFTPAKFEFIEVGRSNETTT